VRITKYETFDAVNYQKWNICKPALKLGNKESIPLYKFLKAAFVRKYGIDWYTNLEKEITRKSDEQ
jgi:hypothetical protein